MYSTLLDSVADPDLPDHLGKPDPDPHQSEKVQPDPRQSQNSRALEVLMEPWRAADAYNGGEEVQNGGVEGLYAIDRRFATL
jgi:hypothetical protein